MQNNNSAEKHIFVTPAQAAEILQVSLATLKKFIYQGKIKTLKTPGGHHRILRNDLFSELIGVTFKTENDSFSDTKLLATIDGFMRVLEKRQKFFHGHAASVMRISTVIGQKLRLAQPQLLKLQLAAFLHDIGKSFISEKILNKNGALTKEEFTKIQKHPQLGEEILKHIAPLKDVSLIVAHHHERYDGSGYPLGLKEEGICQEARIIGLSDAFAVMTAKNSYRERLSVNNALSEIKMNAGKQFDPQIAEVFLDGYTYLRKGKSR